MKAIRNQNYGPADDLRLQDVDRPTIEDDQLLVRVQAASVNPYDWHMMRGEPRWARLIVGIRGPKGGGIPGVDAAGTVETVGANVTEFRPGDEVFGSTSGTFAEYTVGRERHFVEKPRNLSFEQAAAIPGAGVTALQAVRDHGAVEAAQHVLINGAAGGVGTFAVQIAKSLGAHVTGVCSTQNVALVRSLGADEVVDYTADDFTRSGPYDVIVDNVGNRSFRALRRALRPTGTLVVVGGGLSKKGGAKMMNRFVEQRLVSFIATVRKAEMISLKELIEAGEVTPAIDRTYALSEAPEAIRYVETGHARAKVVITV
jgi:NADPH:quinone reductase-like Zn-dependent oxidoreductase